MSVAIDFSARSAGPRTVLPVTPSIRLLDIGCGPGYVSEAASASGAIPTGIDFSPQMIQRAEKRNPGLEFQTADAHELPFEDETFDAVVSNFGLLHLSRPEKAFAEIFRVLRPGGKLGFSLWAKPEDNPRSRILSEAIQAHGETNISLPQGPPKFLFTERGKTSELLCTAGFMSSSVQFSTISREWQIPSASAWLNAECKGSVRTAAVLARQSNSHLEDIRTAVDGILFGGYGT